MTEIIRLESKILRNNEIPTNNIDGEIGMLDVEQGRYFALDSIGSEIWDMIETPISVNEVIDRLTKDYDVSKEQCTADVVELFESLYNVQLINIFNP